MRALLSVASRDGISTFARELQALNVEIYATDGTREHLAEDGIEVGSVSELTNVPPLVGGQVKTFHPAVYAGILARRDDPAQLEELAVAAEAGKQVTLVADTQVSVEKLVDDDWTAHEVNSLGASG